MKISRVLLAVAAAAAVACGPEKAKEAAPMQPGFEKYVCDGAFFEAQVPSSWKKSENITTGRQTKEYGADFTGASDPDGSYARISLIYYGPDHGRMTLQKYIALNSKPDPLLPIAGETFGPVQDVKVAGRAAKAFDRKTFDFIPPYAVQQKKVPVFERRTVIPAEKGGFYVALFHAPSDIAADVAPVYEKVLGSFLPAR